MGTNLTNVVSVNCAINFYIAPTREKAKMRNLPFSTRRGGWRITSSRGLFWLELLRWQHLLMEESHSVKGCKIKGQNWVRLQTPRYHWGHTGTHNTIPIQPTIFPDQVSLYSVHTSSITFVFRHNIPNSQVLSIWSSFKSYPTCTVQNEISDKYHILQGLF